MRYKESSIYQPDKQLESIKLLITSYLNPATLPVMIGYIFIDWELEISREKSFKKRNLVLFI